MSTSEPWVITRTSHRKGSRKGFYCWAPIPEDEKTDEDLEKGTEWWKPAWYSLSELLSLMQKGNVFHVGTMHGNQGLEVGPKVELMLVCTMNGKKRPLESLPTRRTSVGSQSSIRDFRVSKG